MQNNTPSSPRRSLSAALCAGAAALALLTAPGGARADAPGVVASIPPVHSITAAVMEGVGEPELLLSGGSSPHSYSLRPSEAQSLEQADLIVWVGPTLETFLEDPLDSLSSEARQLRLMEVAGVEHLTLREGGGWEAHAHDHGGHNHGGHDQGQDAHAEHADGEAGHDDHAHEDHGHDHAHEGHAAHDHDDEHGHDQENGHDEENGHDHGGSGDAHVWLDPLNGVRLAQAIAEALSEIDPENAEAYSANAAALGEELRSLDAQLAERLQPVVEVPYIVFHDAYQYFEAHYGLNAIGSITVSPEYTPGARRLQELRERIQESGAACVFREPQFTPALVETVIEGTGAQAGVLDPLGAELSEGPQLYPALLEAMADSLIDCLGDNG